LNVHADFERSLGGLYGFFRPEFVTVITSKLVLAVVGTLFWDTVYWARPTIMTSPLYTVACLHVVYTAWGQLAAVQSWFNHALEPLAIIQVTCI